MPSTIRRAFKTIAFFFHPSNDPRPLRNNQLELGGVGLSIFYPTTKTEINNRISIYKIRNYSLLYATPSAAGDMVRPTTPAKTIIVAI